MTYCKKKILFYTKGDSLNSHNRRCKHKFVPDQRKFDFLETQNEQGP
jgi:hypothetical protein